MAGTMDQPIHQFPPCRSEKHYFALWLMISIAWNCLMIISSSCLQICLDILPIETILSAHQG